MVYYDVLNYDSFNEYFDDFYSNILETSFVFGNFSWNKINNTTYKILSKIAFLDLLSKINKDEVEDYFKILLKNYPNIVSVLPLILGISRYNKSSIDILENSIKTFDFNPHGFDLDDIIDFSKKSGLLDILSNVGDLHSFIMGIKVSSYMNNIKNSNAIYFKPLIKSKLEELLYDTEYNIEFEKYVNDIHRDKIADFIITKDDKQLLVIECNFYNSGGSKPIEVANAYLELQSEIDDIDAKFLWITDGLAWNSMKNPLRKSMEGVDYVLNYSMLDDCLMKILNDVDGN